MSIPPYPLSPDSLPQVLPIFPIPGALLLPRGQMPLNIFEPRYLAMVDAALAGTRMIGMIQPEPGEDGTASLYSTGCAGRITQFAETGDGRYIIHLTGISRFRLVEELSSITAYRQARVDFTPFADDLTPRLGEESVDRTGLLAALKAFTKANHVDMDWDSVKSAPNEALVNALSMMAPYGVREKQALLEAKDLQARADMLIAITEIELARGDGDGGTSMQ